MDRRSAKGLVVEEMGQTGEVQRALHYRKWYREVQRLRSTWNGMDRRSAKGHKTPLGYNTDHGRMALDQYNSLGEHCGPHTASSVFLILIIVSGQKEGWMMLRLVEGGGGGESKLK